MVTPRELGKLTLPALPAWGDCGPSRIRSLAARRSASLFLWRRTSCGRMCPEAFIYVSSIRHDPPTGRVNRFHRYCLGSSCTTSHLTENCSIVN
jgi:hypothetical protein